MPRALLSDDGLDEEVIEIGFAVGRLGCALDEHTCLYSNEYSFYQGTNPVTIRDYIGSFGGPTPQKQATFRKNPRQLALQKGKNDQVGLDSVVEGQERDERRHGPQGIRAARITPCSSGGALDPVRRRYPPSAGGCSLPTARRTARPSCTSLPIDPRPRRLTSTGGGDGVVRRSGK